MDRCNAETRARAPCPHRAVRDGLCALHFSLSLCEEVVWEDRGSLKVIGPILSAPTALLELTKACSDVWAAQTPVVLQPPGPGVGKAAKVSGQPVGLMGIRRASARLGIILNQARDLSAPATPRLTHELVEWLEAQDEVYLARLCAYLETTVDHLLAVAE